MDNRQSTVFTGNLTKDYFSNQKVLDECFIQQDEARESWKNLLTNIDKLGAAELNVRQQELLKLLQENGVTYNV